MTEGGGVVSGKEKSRCRVSARAGRDVDRLLVATPVTHCGEHSGEQLRVVYKTRIRTRR